MGLDDYKALAADLEQAYLMLDPGETVRYFSWASAAEKFLALYRELLQAGKPG